MKHIMLFSTDQDMMLSLRSAHTAVGPGAYGTRVGPNKV